MNRIQEGSSGNVFLLTGGTGFLGKVLLEHLVRQRDELNIEKVYVLIRPRGTLSAEQRFLREVVPSPCFSRSPPDWSSCVSVLEGQLDESGLKLAPSTRDEVTREVTHVLHSAASIAFDLPLPQAAQSNVATTLNLLELTQDCSRLEKFVYISTAYVSPFPGEDVPIEEKLAPLPERATDIYNSILDGSHSEAELLSISGHRNTYTLTKSIAEHLLTERRGDVPLAIVRPSIISASLQHPFPGWIDSTAGFAAFVVLHGMGHMRVVGVDKPDSKIDLIPVDEVANRVLFACQSPRTEGGLPSIDYAASGLKQSPTVRECCHAIREFYSTHRVDRIPRLKYIGPQSLRFKIADAFHHRLPVAVARSRGRRERRAANQLLARLTYINTAFPYFAQSFDFRSTELRDEIFDKPSYLRTVSRGVYRHILGRDDSEWVMAGRQHEGHSGGDLRWARRQPDGSALIRFTGWAVTKVLRRCCSSVTLDIPSFERARRSAPEGSALVLLPSHRSYFDFVLCSFLCFARPDLRIPIPYIAAAIEFGNIPMLGRILRSLNAFWVRRGTGRELKEVSRVIHGLVQEGEAIEFFVEGTRSRSREFLAPKRGLLRCLQATGETSTLLPIGFSYDRVPEEAAFAKELSGAPKPKMSLGALISWTIRVFRGQVNLGRIHIACADPIRMSPDCDARATSHRVIDQLKSATITTTFHLRAFLDYHPIEGVDVAALQNAIEERGGRVLKSDLEVPEDLDPLIAWTMRHQFAHLFEADTSRDDFMGEIARKLFISDAEKMLGEQQEAVAVEPESRAQPSA